MSIAVKRKYTRIRMFNGSGKALIHYGTMDFNALVTRSSSVESFLKLLNVFSIFSPIMFKGRGFKEAPSISVYCGRALHRSHLL